MVGRGIVKVKNRIRMRYELGEIGCNDDNSIRGESKSGDERKCREITGMIVPWSAWFNQREYKAYRIAVS